MTQSADDARQEFMRQVLHIELKSKTRDLRKAKTHADELRTKIASLEHKLEQRELDILSLQERLRTETEKSREARDITGLLKRQLWGRPDSKLEPGDEPDPLSLDDKQDVQQLRELHSVDTHRCDKCRPTFGDRDAKYMCATVSNAYFRVCQNAAHWEEQVLLLRTQNEILAKRVKFQEFVEKSVLILRDVFKQLLDYFADQQVHDQAYLKTTSEILRKLELVAKSEPRWKSLFRHFDNLTQTIGAELGTGPYALLFEDVHCAMARVMDLVIEQFAPEESKNDEADEHAEHVRHVRRTAFELYPVDHDQMMKYMFKIQTLETSLLEFSKDHQAHLDAALWFAKLAENCSLTNRDIQTRHAERLLHQPGLLPGSRIDI